MRARGEASPEGETQALAAARKAAAALFSALAARGKRAVFAESCTGGLLSALLTEIPGSSALLWGSLVVYTEEAKTALLGVSPRTLERWGAVSAQTAGEMARGALERSGADLALAVTGFAGPEAPEAEGGPGRVVLAWALRGGGEALVEERRFPGGRAEVRYGAAAAALEGGLRLLEGAPEANSRQY